jgi:hypothetical protein
MKFTTHCRGAALLAILVTLALAVLPVIAMYRYTFRLQELYQLEVHGVKAKYQATEEVLNNPAQVSGGCAAGSAAHGKHEVTRRLCSVRQDSLSRLGAVPPLVGYGQMLPWFNYHLVFKDAPKCSVQAAVARLSSSTSQYSCVNLSDGEDITVRKGNIILNGALVIGDAATNLPTAFIAASGDLEITGDLVLNKDAIVIAGGRVRISNVISSTGAPVQLALVSAHEDITIQNISTGILVEVVAAKASRVPGVVRAPVMLAPLLRSEVTLGLN